MDNRNFIVSVGVPGRNVFIERVRADDHAGAAFEAWSRSSHCAARTSLDLIESLDNFSSRWSVDHGRAKIVVVEVF